MTALEQFNYERNLAMLGSNETLKGFYTEIGPLVDTGMIRPVFKEDKIMYELTEAGLKEAEKLT
jgi:hypothetical protein